MTYEEARDILISFPTNTDGEISVISMAIKCIEKQIPKPVIKEHIGFGKDIAHGGTIELLRYHCHDCNMILGYHHFQIHRCSCGQAIEGSYGE